MHFLLPVHTGLQLIIIHKITKSMVNADVT
jgi:hypothetical protein